MKAMKILKREIKIDKYMEVSKNYRHNLLTSLIKLISTLADYIKVLT